MYVFSVSARSLHLTTSQPKFLSGKLNQLLEITVNVIAYPENVTFTWRKRDILNTNMDYLITKGHLSTTLTIINFTLKHNGTYTLNMENGIGKPALYTFYVLVEGKCLWLLC